MEKIYSHGDIVIDRAGKHWVIDRLTLMGVPEFMIECVLNGIC